MGVALQFSGLARPGTKPRPVPARIGPKWETLQPGQKISIVCFTEGESVYGNDYWFRVGQGGQMGFVHKEFIVPDGYVEHC